MEDIKTNYKKENVSKKAKYLMGETAVISFPIPDIKGDIMVEKHFVYIVSFAGKTKRPVATLTTEMGSGILLEFVNCGYNDYMNTKDYPLTATPDYVNKKTTVDEIATNTKELLDCYQIVRNAAFKDSLSKEEKQATEKYKKIFKKLVPDSLLPYYKSLGTKFFEWLGWKE